MNARGADATNADATGACGLAIFVKTPGHSALKTRLAAGIGSVAARAFHHLAADATGAVARAAMARDPGLHAYWAIAEDAALDAPCWSSLLRIAQGDGDLGARMHRVCTTLQRRHGAVLLIGADAPQLGVDDVLAARCALADRDHVLGDSEDGGFWLFGTRADVPEAAWATTPWSQPDTAARFAAALGGTSIARVRMLRDVDTVADLLLVAHALAALHDPLPEQHALAEWMRRVTTANL